MDRRPIPNKSSIGACKEAIMSQDPGKKDRRASELPESAAKLSVCAIRPNGPTTPGHEKPFPENPGLEGLPTQIHVRKDLHNDEHSANRSGSSPLDQSVHSTADIGEANVNSLVWIGTKLDLGRVKIQSESACQETEERKRRLLTRSPSSCCLQDGLSLKPPPHVSKQDARFRRPR